MTICSLCGATIRATATDPVVTAPSLGKGAFHYACAFRVWNGIQDETPPEQDPIDEVADLAMRYRNTCCGEE